MQRGTAVEKTGKSAISGYLCGMRWWYMYGCMRPVGIVIFCSISRGRKIVGILLTR